MYQLFKKIAFQFDPEFAHHLSIKGLQTFPGVTSSLFNLGQAFDSERYQVQLGPNKWSFPIGLAAGLDKNAECINFFSNIPFGAVEVGTVTPMPQAGNDKPRLFRIPEQASLRNRMGFNNDGADEVLKNIKGSSSKRKVLGVNLGKNKVTSQEDAFKDYQKLYDKFHSVADYLVVNISSPNTPGLRDLQKTEEMKVLFDGLASRRKENPKPLYLKISPDVANDDVPGIVELCHNYNLTGIIATNTTIMPDLGNGGISGRLVKDRSKNIRNLVLKTVRENNYNLEVIGVGGVDCFEDLLDFWKNGGKCMQLYTSFIYHGPQVLYDIKKGIDKMLNEKSCSNVEELIKKLQG
jgi:dihydroorotate dehydrogenase